MQAQANRWMLRQNFYKWQVGVLIGAFDHVVEVPDWLVRMQQQNQLKFCHRDPLNRFIG
jgi:hypothetical protein